MIITTMFPNVKPVTFTKISYLLLLIDIFKKIIKLTVPA